MAPQNVRDVTFIKCINEIIEANLSNERFGVSELAREMHMSRSNLHRRIKSTTGASVSQYLRMARLNEALALLKEGSLTVSEVAFQVGFGSPAYFTKCFRDHFGFPPGKTTVSTPNDTDLAETPNAGHIDESGNQMYNFPVQTTSFIGREKEIETILDLIEKHRIVSLIGTGGSGKTRLACEAISRNAKVYRDGIWFVELAPVESEELVLKQLMSTLEIAEIPGRDMMEVLIERVREKKLLILLDNCEHILRSCAEIAGKLSEAVPGLALLVTSREALNIKGEKVWDTLPLTLIDPASIIDVEYARSAESVRLFSDRALLQNPGFKLSNENVSDVATICTKVDGIPLAIELVSSRARHMDTDTMLDRLSGRFAEIPSPDPRTIERHKTLQATIDWSYNLLKEFEKALFRRISVFTGGFDLMAVEEVCANEFLKKENIIELLSRLIDTSMIQTTYMKPGQMRYSMLETLRQYASDLLEKENEADEISTKHLEYFTRIAEQAFDERMSSQAKWMEKIQLEHSNLVAALRWAELHKPEIFSLLVGNLSWLWARSNNYSLAIDIYEKEIISNTSDNRTQALLATGYGTLFIYTGDNQKALNLLKRASSLWRELQNKKEETLALAEIGNLLYTYGDDESGLEYSQKAYKLALSLDDEGVELYCMLVVSQGLVDLKRTNEARKVLKDIVRLAEKLDNPFGILVSHHQTGDCALIEGEYLVSEKEYGLGLSTSLKYNDYSFSIVEMLGVAMSVAGQGRYAKALRLNAAATKTALTSGFLVPEDYPLVFWHELVLQHIAATREKLGEDLAHQYEEEGRSMSFEEAVEYTLDFDRD